MTVVDYTSVYIIFLPTGDIILNANPIVDIMMKDRILFFSKCEQYDKGE